MFRCKALLVAASVAIAPALVAACSHGGEATLNGPSSLGTASALDNTVSATRSGDQITIRNGTQRAITYAVVDRHFFETALASYCFGSAGCGTALAAGSSVSVAVSKIENVTASSRDAIVFHWYSDDVPSPQGGTPATVSQLVVALR